MPIRSLLNSCVAMLIRKHNLYSVFKYTYDSYRVRIAADDTAVKLMFGVQRKGTSITGFDRGSFAEDICAIEVQLDV